MRQLLPLVVSLHFVLFFSFFVNPTPFAVWGFPLEFMSELQQSLQHWKYLLSWSGSEISASSVTSGQLCGTLSVRTLVVSSLWCIRQLYIDFFPSSRDPPTPTSAAECHHPERNVLTVITSWLQVCDQLSVLFFNCVFFFMFRGKKKRFLIQMLHMM